MHPNESFQHFAYLFGSYIELSKTESSNAWIAFRSSTWDGGRYVVWITYLTLIKLPRAPLWIVLDAANSHRHHLWAKWEPCRWFRMLCFVVCSGCWSVDCATLHRACWINWKSRHGVGLSDRKKVEECKKKPRDNGSKPLQHDYLQPFTEKLSKLSTHPSTLNSP